MDTRVIIFCLIQSFFSYFIFSQEDKQKVSINELGKNVDLLGELKLKLGTVTKVEGKLIEGQSKGYDDGFNFLIYKLNDTVTQFPIIIPINAYESQDVQKAFEQLKIDAFYQLNVYETGAYVGTPLEALKMTDQLIQTTDLYYRNELIVLSIQEIPNYQWLPQYFIGRKALLSGIAMNKKHDAYLIGDGWEMKLDNQPLWDQLYLNKQVQVFACNVNMEDQKSYSGIASNSRLINLNDQIDQTISLNGTLWSMNGRWWFTYRGQEIFLKNIQNLQNFSADLHGKSVELKGLLKLASTENSTKTELPYEFFRSDYVLFAIEFKKLNQLLTPEL